MFVVVAVCDWRTMKIPNVIVFPAVAGAMAFLVWQGLYWNFLTGIGFMLFLLLASRVFTIGYGDVKYALLIGIVIGWPYLLYAVLATAISGIVAASVMLRKGKTPRGLYPYGVFMSIGGIVAILVILFGIPPLT